MPFNPDFSIIQNVFLHNKKDMTKILKNVSRETFIFFTHNK